MSVQGPDFELRRAARELMVAYDALNEHLKFDLDASVARGEKAIEAARSLLSGGLPSTRQERIAVLNALMEGAPNDEDARRKLEADLTNATERVRSVLSSLDREGESRN